MASTLSIQVLETIHEQQLRDRAPDAGSIAKALGARPTQVGEALLVLERRGLVDAARVRLTMVGLAVAAACLTNRSRALARAA
jgi:Mn-dependent DtxR family transcriptional regulator